jgi:murein DD-endopeptidase MepM/ murein hydrolase activator NlpD
MILSRTLISIYFFENYQSNLRQPPVLGVPPIVLHHTCGACVRCGGFAWIRIITRTFGNVNVGVKCTKCCVATTNTKKRLGIFNYSCGGKTHGGLDIYAPIGTEVIAVAALVNIALTVMPQSAVSMCNL